MVLDFARAAIQGENLGQRGATDLLIISLSCTDGVGHAYGPNSQEMLDQLIRLDRELGRFVADIEAVLGTGSVLVALSADHAALPLPEHLAGVEHIAGRRISVRNVLHPGIDRLDSTMQHEWKIPEPLIRSYAFLNYAAASTAGIDSVSLEQHVRAGIDKIDGVAEVYFRRDLVNPANAGLPLVGCLERGFYPARGKDLVILPREYCLFTNSTTGTSHGTPYRYDIHVPILFWGAGVKPQRVARTIHTVDIAPTLAKYCGIAYPSSIDGEPLREMMRY
jgi:predicted AlkP superfamily pyrophosphatase or phosphodiesterase